jgi:hypothetical protein
LFRYRVALGSTSQCEIAPKYKYCGTNKPILAPLSRCSGSQVTDATLIALSVHIAHKFLADKWVNLQYWIQPLELDRSIAFKGERYFLSMIEYRVWVQQNEYLHLRGRFDVLWEAVFSKAARPAPPAFVLKMLGRMA